MAEAVRRMTSIERSVSALAGVLAIAACKEAAAPRPTTSSVPSVVVEDAGSKTPLVVEPPKEDAGVVVEGGSPLRRVDWKNHEYGGWAGRLHEGHAESHIYGPGGGAHDTFETTLVGVAYGDLDNDGVEEAVVVLKESMWIAATSRESTHGTVHAFAWRQGEVKSIAISPFVGPPTGVRIVDRRVIVDEEQQTCARVMEKMGDTLFTSSWTCPP